MKKNLFMFLFTLMTIIASGQKQEGDFFLDEYHLASVASGIYLQGGSSSVKSDLYSVTFALNANSEYVITLAGEQNISFKVGNESVVVTGSFTSIMITTGEDKMSLSLFVRSTNNKKGEFAYVLSYVQ